MKNVENIDWNLYKGKETDKSKKTYMKFISCLNENGWTLKSDYIKSSEKVTIVCKKNGHEKLISPNAFLNKNYKDCKECRKANKESIKKPKEKVKNVKKDVKKKNVVTKQVSINKKLTKEQGQHFESVDKGLPIKSKLTARQLEHFINVDKKVRCSHTKEKSCDIKIESNKDFFEIDDSTRFPKNYNVTLGIPMKSVNLKEELRKSRLLGQISRMDDILEFSKIEKNN
ncbi:hypothetical protein [Clostridium perfringens]|uniref:hypothetical protein n=1 Tax=Clostridium perfringens TaxID=1502 RepID=UPI0039EC079E